MKDCIDDTITVNKEPLTYLMDLGKATGRNLVSDLVTMYTEETPAEIQKLKLSVIECNYPTVSRIAHSLKSSSLNLGLIEMGSIFAKIEEIAERHDRSDFDIWVLVEDAETVIKPSMSALHQIVAEIDQARRIS